MRLGPIKKFANSLIQEVRVHRRLLAALAAMFLLQFYFVRELLAVELFFALGFAVVFMLGGPTYLIGSAACHGWRNLEEVRQKPRNLIEKNRSELHGGSREEVRTLDPVEPFNVTERYAVEQKKELPHATSI